MVFTNRSRILNLLLFIGLALFSAGSVFASVTFDASGLTPITVQLKWKHQFQFAGYYAAVEKGFYQEAGLNVTLKEAGPSIQPVEEVLSGRAQYGVANSELMLYRLKGEPVVALAAIIQHSPVVLMSLKDSNIFSPQDLIGKRVMYPSGAYGANTLGILHKEGVELSQITSVPLSFNIMDLVDNNVDAMVGYVTDQPFLLKEKGIPYNLIDYRNYGVDFYGDVLFSSEKIVDTKPNEVALFRAATIKGWQYAIENSDEIIQLILERYHTLKTEDELRYEAVETIKLIVPKLVDMGHMNPGRWTHIAETFVGLGMAEGVFQDDGFIYIPEKKKAELAKEFFFRVVVVIVAVALFFIAILFYFNKKLKDAVSEKTLYLTEANENLFKANAAKNEFLSVMSHEVRTPLNAIIGFTTRLLAKSDNLTERQLDSLEIVSKESKGLLQVMNDILDFSRMERNEVSATNASMSLKEILNSQVDLFRDRSEVKGIELSVDSDSIVIDTVLGDRIKISQILNNYLSNAIKFSDSGSVILFASSNSAAGDQGGVVNIEFGVKDSGVGLDESELGEVFKPFSQAESFSTRSHGGTGLSLATCKKLAEIMKGKVWVESEKGGGSTFFFSVALARDGAVEAGPSVGP